MALIDATKCVALLCEQVPIATIDKVRALSADLGTQARLAELLGVSRSRVTRWLKGEGIDDLNADHIDQLELVMSMAFRLYEPEAVRAWLTGFNPLLGNRRPIWFIRRGRFEEVLNALRQERAESYA